MQKTEIINIKFNKEIDNQAFLSKNLYNYANYLIRQEFITNKKWIRYYQLNDLCKNNENYKLLPAQTSQQLLRILDKNWKSFFKAIKDWKKYPEKYLGKPKLPKYKNKTNGRNILIYPFQNLRIKDGYINIPKTNYSFKVRDKINNINQIRIIPQHSVYKIEIIYTINLMEMNDEIKNILSIDLGVNNFVASFNNLGLNPLIINGRNMKSINQFYNKKRSKLISTLTIKNDIHWSKKLGKLTIKRNNKLNDFFHKTSKYLVDYCINNKIDTVIIGYNKTWKQNVNMKNKSNQNFTFISFLKFVNMLDYKLFENGIKLIKTEESYTSKIDHLANESMKHHEKYLGKRIKRGLFKSSTGKIINADINGAIGIFRKVAEKWLMPYSVEDLVFNPIKINIF